MGILHILRRAVHGRVAWVLLASFAATPGRAEDLPRRPPGRVVWLTTRSLQADAVELSVIDRIAVAELTRLGCEIVSTREVAAQSSEDPATLEQARREIARGRELLLRFELSRAGRALQHGTELLASRAADVFLPGEVSEAYLQLGVALAEANAPQAQVVRAIQTAILIAPERRLEPSLYNPTIRRLYEGVREALAGLPEPTAALPGWRFLTELVVATHLLWPLVIEQPGGGERLRVAAFDLASGRKVFVQEIDLPSDESGRRDATQTLAQTVWRRLRGEADDAGPGRAVESTSSSYAFALTAGGSLGVGGYARWGAAPLRFSVYRRFGVHGGLVASLAGQSEQASRVIVRDAPYPIVEADLAWSSIPIDLAAYLVWPLGPLELQPRVGAIAEWSMLTGKTIYAGPGPTPTAFAHNRSHGFGVGGIAGLAVWWNWSSSWALVTCASYRLTKVFFRQPLVVETSDTDTVNLPPRDIHQGLELHFGLAWTPEGSEPQRP